MSTQIILPHGGYRGLLTYVPIVPTVPNVPTVPIPRLTKSAFAAL